MIPAMKTTIDNAGRIVVPKAIREGAGLVSGADLEIRLVNGRIEIEPAPTPVRLVRRGRFLVAVPRDRRPLRPLTIEEVNRTQDELREKRGRAGG
jgi:AbrB family looped-hinge helix DNA binding protein